MTRRNGGWSVLLLTGLVCMAVLSPTTAAVAQVLPYVAEFPVLTSNSYPLGITVGADGNLWFTEWGYTEPHGNSIGRITPFGVVTEFPLPNKYNSNPYAIAAGPDGNVWFTEIAGKIGRITPSGTITEFSTPYGGSLNGITSAADGNIWFTATNYNRIARMTPSGVITEFAVPTVRTSPWRITAGPDGNVWFTEQSWNAIGRVTPAGTITEFLLPSNRYGDAITAGPDGNVWFTLNSGGVGRITPSGSITLLNVPVFGLGITAGPDGNLWVADYTFDRIARITPAGVVTQFPVPTNNAKPYGIAAGPDGNIWFTEYFADKIGRVTLVDPGPGPPSAPTNLAASVAGSRVLLTWNAPASGGAATSYAIEAGTFSGARNVAVIETGTTATTFATNLGMGTYYLRVTARNAFGVSVASNEVIVAVGGFPTPPTNVAASVAGSTVTLTWNAPSSRDATSFVIEAGSTTLATNVAVFDTGSTATVLPVNAVPTGVYYVRVRARNAFGSSAASNEIAIVVGPLPGAPADLSANVIGSSVHLTWRAPASGVAPSSYIIEAGASRGASNLAVIDTAFDGPAFSTHNVPSGVYYVRVRARNAFGSGLASNEVTVVVGSQ